MRTEREADRYEPLNETHRRVAAEEEKRRLAERDQARSAPAQPEPEPYRPATEPKPYRPDTEPDHDPDSPEARLAARQEELEEQVKQGRITQSEMIYRLRRFDNQLSVERAEGATPPPVQQRSDPGNRQDEMAAELEHGEPQSSQRPEDTRDTWRDQVRNDPSQRVPETGIERDAAAAEYEVTGPGEMSDARAARLERLRGIDRAIERESRENDGPALDRDHHGGDRSR